MGASSLEQGYAFWSDGLAQTGFETVVDPCGVHSIVAGVVAPVADAMLEASACWMSRAERARADAAAFEDDQEAQ